LNTQQLSPNCKDIAEINKNQGIPHGWKQVRFKDCIEIANGQVDPKVEPYCNMKHVGLENIEKFTGRLLFAKLAKDENLTSGKYLFNEGDVLYGKIRPELSKVYLAEFEGICSADIYPLKPKKDIIAKFLKYILLDHRFFRYAVSVSARTGLPKINRDDLGGFKIHVPPIREQQKIADILSTWDKAIELKEKLIEQKKELKKGLMQRLLTGKVRFSGFDKEWRSVPIESVCELSIGKTPSRKVQKYWGKGHKWIAISDMKDKYITNTQEEITDLALKETGIQVIPKGTVIMSFKLTLGRLAITGEDMYSNEAIVSFRIKNPDVLDYEFLYYYLSSIDITKYGSQAAKGITLNSDSLKEIMIKLPTKCEQIKIRDALCFYDKKIDLLEQELEALKQQKKGLMQLLLTGKVRVKC
jgi:type I restriction enzyme S subunit